MCLTLRTALVFTLSLWERAGVRGKGDNAHIFL